MTVAGSLVGGSEPAGSSATSASIVGRIVALPRRFDERFTAPGSSRRLVLVRAGLAVVLGLRIAPRNWAGMAQRPAALFDPIGIGQWFPSMPGAGVLWALRIIGTVAAVAVVAHRAPRLAFAVSWGCLLVLAALYSSAGKILHNDVLLVLTCIPMLLAPADAGVGDRSETRRWGWPPRACLAVVGTVYFLTGFQKLHHSGIRWVTSSNMRWVLYQGANSGKTHFPGLARDMAGVAWATHPMAAFAILTELSAPFLLWFRPTRRVFLVAVIGMHGVIWLTLGLDYWGWILTVAAVTLPAATVAGSRAATVSGSRGP